MLKCPMNCVHDHWCMSVCSCNGYFEVFLHFYSSALLLPTNFSEWTSPVKTDPTARILWINFLLLMEILQSHGEYQRGPSLCSKVPCSYMSLLQFLFGLPTGAPNVIEVWTKLYIHFNPLVVYLCMQEPRLPLILGLVIWDICCAVLVKLSYTVIKWSLN